MGNMQVGVWGVTWRKEKKKKKKKRGINIKSFSSHLTTPPSYRSKYILSRTIGLFSKQKVEEGQPVDMESQFVITVLKVKSRHLINVQISKNYSATCIMQQTVHGWMNSQYQLVGWLRPLRQPFCIAAFFHDLWVAVAIVH